MNAIVRVVDNEAVTDSLTLADGSGNQHKNVLELVRNYVSDLEEFGRVTFETLPFETAGGTQAREVALLNEHQATLLLTYMRNSKRIRTFKKQLVTAFFKMADQLKNKSMMVDLSNPAAVRDALLDYSQKLIEKEAEIQANRPKVAFHDHINNMEDCQTMAAVAKALGIGRNKLFAMLRENNVLDKGNLPYQRYLDGGHFKVIETVKEKKTGQAMVFTQTVVTGKGITYLQKKFFAEN